MYKGLSFLREIASPDLKWLWNPKIFRKIAANHDFDICWKKIPETGDFQNYDGSTKSFEERHTFSWVNKNFPWNWKVLQKSRIQFFPWKWRVTLTSRQKAIFPWKQGTFFWKSKEKTDDDDVFPWKWGKFYVKSSAREYSLSKLLKFTSQNPFFRETSYSYTRKRSQSILSGNCREWRKTENFVKVRISRQIADNEENSSWKAKNWYFSWNWRHPPMKTPIDLKVHQKDHNDWKEEEEFKVC